MSASWMLLVAVIGLGSTAWAAHPLITDDTGTQGKGNAQLELNGAYGWDTAVDAGSDVKTRKAAGETVLSYGVLESLDVILAMAQVRTEESVDGVTARERGSSDAGLLVKWRFWEREHYSFAVKPGLLIPLGSENKELGAGKYGYVGFLAATQETGDLAFHENIGYIRYNNRNDERENLYHLSVAAEYAMTDRLKIVANVRQEQNPDRSSRRKLTFLLGGLIYALTEDVDIDIGYQAGLSEPEMDSLVLAGMAVRF